MDIQNDEFTIDGKPLYIRAIGYVPLRPHQKPGGTYTGINYNWMNADFERIRAARFNTLRTWEAFGPEELELARRHGLFVLQGIRLDPKQDFSRPRNRANAVAAVEQVAQASHAFDNVLGYLVISRPHPEAAANAGLGATQDFFQELRRAIRAIDARPVSIDSWIPTTFLDHSGYDFVAFTAFDFWPESIMKTLGYPAALRWLKSRFGPEKPFLVSSTGGYAVSVSSRGPAGGFGGLDEDGQSARALAALRGAIEGHAAGSTLFSWIDHWWGADDADTHDDDPWEWTGMLAIAQDRRKDFIGKGRRMLRDVSAFNAEAILEPRENHLYPAGVPVPLRVDTAPDVVYVRYSVNGGDWRSLERGASNRWEGSMSFSERSKRRQRVAVRALDRDQSIITEQVVSFVYAVDPERLTIKPERTRLAGGLMQFSAEVRDTKREPAAARRVFFGCFFPMSLREGRGEVKTDAAGTASFTCPEKPAREDRYVYIAAGTDSPDRVRTGDWQIFEIDR